MMNNNHKNSNCGFSEQLVSYLYGETGGAENTSFEAHLQSCKGCAEELEAFSGVHFSINDWKLKEFANLATPSIEIPFEKAEKPVEVSSVTGSWLSALRDLFSLSPRGWSLATASFAVFAVAVGIALFALNSGKDTEITENNTKSKPVIAPTAEKTPEPTNVNANQNNQPDKAVKQLNEPKPPQTEIAASEPDSKNSRVVKAPNNPRPAQKVVSADAQKSNQVKRNKNNNEVPPKIVVDDEDEDNTLRLAELFDEIDTKE